MKFACGILTSQRKPSQQYLIVFGYLLFVLPQRFVVTVIVIVIAAAVDVVNFLASRSDCCFLL